MFETNINLELSWQGSYSLQDEYAASSKKTWDIDAVYIEITNSIHEIFSNINTHIPVTTEQRLNFIVCDKQYRSKERYPAIEYSIDRLKDLSMFAKISQPKSLSNRCSFQMVEEKFERISIDKFPVFEAGETYRIRVINQDNALRATITKVTCEIAYQASPEEKDYTAIDELRTEMVNNIWKDGEGFDKIFYASFFPNPKLNALETPKLQQRLETAKQKLVTTKNDLVIATKRGNIVNISTGQKAQKEITQEIMSLHKALLSRGISDDFMKHEIKLF